MTLLRSLLAYLLLALDTLLRRARPALPEAPMPFAAHIVDLAWTPYPLADLDDCIQVGHHRHFGMPLWPTSLSVVRALMELEHGVADGKLHGLAGNCWGNFDATTEELDDASVKVFRTVPEREIMQGAVAKARHWRVASEDAESGMERWWRVMAIRFGEVVDILHGEGLAYAATTKEIADAVALKMKELRYYTEEEPVYARGLERLSAA